MSARRGIGFFAVIGTAGAAYYIWQQRENERAAYEANRASIINANAANLAAWQNSQPDTGDILKQAATGLAGGAIMDLFFGRSNTSTNTDSTPQPQAGGSGWLSGLFGGGGAQSGTTATSGANSGSGGLSGLLDWIGGEESGGDYNQAYARIPRSEYPAGGLTSQTINQIIAWQRVVGPKYGSSAAGKYQFMPNTLTELRNLGYVSGSALFSPSTQDMLAEARLRQARGLDAWQRGAISDEEFAQNLSKEWAILPAVTGDKFGNAAQGQSYYDGIAGNKSGVSISELLDRVRAAKT